jgi:hypothetical protein
VDRGPEGGGGGGLLGSYLVTVLVEEGGEEGDVAGHEGQHEEGLHQDGKAVTLVKVKDASHR